MAHAEQVEIERKYSVGDSVSLPGFEGLEPSGGITAVVGLDPVELEAVYFDTEGGALAANRIALRRRAGGHDEGWHIKLPAAEGRRELQWPLQTGDEPGSGAEAGVPAELLDAVRVYVRDRPLTPLARIATTRRVTELRDASGAVVVEIADDLVRATDAREGTLRLWREWEAELGPAAPDTKKGRSALLDAVEERLLAVGATLSPSVSKLAQAMGRTGLGHPTAPSAAVPAGSTAAGVVSAGLAELVAELIELDPAVRRDAPDAVHRMRTLVRRLRGALASHRRLFEPAQVDELRDELSRFGAVLGEARDLEVRADWAAHALDELKADRGVDDPDARRRLVDDTRAEHDEAHAKLVAVLSQAPYFRLLDALEEFVARESAVSSAAKPRAEARSAVKRAGRRAVSRAVRAREAELVFGPDAAAAATTAGELHASRKAARRLRYAAEFSTAGAAGVLGESTERLGDVAEELQDALGWHRDASLFAEFVLLTSRRAEAAGEGSFTYGVLYQRSLDQARRALAIADDARRDLRRAL
ncbi:CYTH and CHAD domain-containing protein [Herbiconiux sp. 11R-BC]|uniref:CYTH and CHAD domain-containing protein n=1 Tax=Herbiconiux sp. 11R-BC TaxID=3111637 RepID=UPI003C045160